ncbi:MAG: hypothetical protein GEU78_16555 [Actinobacteria bacterium]|nr:hypothetical protein [Actinomycetota bacterium]
MALVKLRGSDEVVEVNDSRARHLIRVGRARTADREDMERFLQSSGFAPTQSATKAEWADYAVEQGMDRADAEAATKADLIDLFTGEDDG